jgi:hypothetical protein
VSAESADRSIGWGSPLAFAPSAACCRKCLHANERHLEVPEHCVDCGVLGGPCA